MNCKQAQFSMALFIANDPDFIDQQCIDFQEHLKKCSECAKECEESKFTIELAKQYWSISDDTVALIEKAGQSYKPKMTVEEGWKDLCKRCPDLAESTEKQKSLQLFLRIGSACLIIGILTWMVFSNYSKPQTLSHNPGSQQVVPVPKPSVKVELVTNTGNIPISSDQQIISTDELKTLVINGKHRMTLNTNTILAIEPLEKNSNIGCLVKLDCGRIYTHVQHDCNPFIVDTVHGEAVITSTTFDIKATDTDTTLIVSEGIVQFKSESGSVKIVAGQSSKIIGKSAPSNPILCNAVELTAWATGYKPEPALAQAKSDADDWYLALSLRKVPIILEETDYDNWVKQNQDWFKQEFPWIFQLKDALAKENIEADCPELLIKTGDIWQFVCLELSPARFSVINPDSLLKTAFAYGFDKQWLLKNVPAAQYVIEKPVLSKNSFTDLQAFERWLEYFDKTKELEPPKLICSYHASKYLENTRSLIWFAVRDGKYDLTDEECAEILILLQEEVTAACKCQNDVTYPMDAQNLSHCEDKCHVSTIQIIESISTIYECEKTLTRYLPVASSILK